jgi:hypothetical protein
MRGLIASVILLFSLVLAQSLIAQQSPCDQAPAPISAENPLGFPPLNAPSRPDPIAAEQQHKQAESRNKERQSSLKKDTDQLLQLATELKQSVDKTNEHVLSLDVIKKTEAVEKLAKSIREKMRANGYCDFPAAGQ